MVIHGNNKCVTFDDLVGSGILSNSNYKKKVSKGLLHVVQKGGNGRQALINYTTLPTKIKAAVDKLPNMNSMESITLVLPSDDEGYIFFRDHKPEIEAEVQERYLLNARVLNEMNRLWMETAAMHKKCGHLRTPIIWDIVLDLCEQMREVYCHTLPTNEARLRQKFNEYKRFGYKVLINKNTGNKNTTKLGEAEKRLIIKLRRSIMPIYTEQQLFEEYNRQAEEQGLQLIKSPTTVRNYLYSPAVMPLWFASQHGYKKWKQKYCSQFKTRLPDVANSRWEGDGTKLNLYYRDDKNKMCTINVYEVMDVATEVFLGYDIAPTEKFDSQYRAYRMAVEVAKVRPYEIVTDNQGSQRTSTAQAFFAKLAVVAKPTMPYNGQSKSIESAFGRFQQQVLHKLWNFTGQNVTATKLNSKPNIEFITQNAYALPTFSELKEIYAKCRDEWNNGLHPTSGLPRMEMYKMSENPEAQPVSDIEMRRLFWLYSSKPVTYNAYGLRIDINKKEYHYDVYGKDGLRDEAWAMQNTGAQFYVMYDPMNFDTVELWKATAQGKVYSTTAVTKFSIARGTQQRTSDENSHMRKQLERNNELMAALQITSEEFDIDEKIAAELFQLSTLDNKHLKKEKMKTLREKHSTGDIQSPFAYPEVEEEIASEVGYDSLGTYTKQVSNLTFDEVDIYDII